MRATEILYPLDSDLPLHEMKQHKEKLENYPETIERFKRR